MTPEVQRATERLNALPEAWLTDGFRAAVLKVAEAEAMRRGIAENVRDLLSQETVALGNADVAGAVQLRERAAGLAQLTVEIPAVDPALAAEVLGRAVQPVAQALADIPDLPIAAFELELVAYRSLAPRARQACDPPGAMWSDRAAQAELQALTSRRQSVLDTVAAWRSNLTTGVDPLTHLESARDTITLVEAYKQRHAEVAANVAKANAARTKAGLTWIHPVGAITPELEALWNSRRNAFELAKESR